MCGVGAACAAESVFSSLGEELCDEGGVCTFLGGTGMSLSSMSIGKYETLQAPITQNGLAKHKYICSVCCTEMAGHGTQEVYTGRNPHVPCKSQQIV